MKFSENANEPDEIVSTGLTRNRLKDYLFIQFLHVLTNVKIQ